MILFRSLHISRARRNLQVGSFKRATEFCLETTTGKSNRLLAIVIAAIAAMTAAQPPLAAAAAGNAPNIVIILADDLGIGDLGVYGQNARATAGLPAIKTPNIDALAAQSMSFTRMYSTPICSPSRASILTGFEQHHLIQEMPNDATGLRPGEQDKTWGQTLQESGYRTAMYGKWHLGGVDYPGSAAGVYEYGEIPTQNGFETVFGTMNGGYHPAQLWQQDGAGGLKLVPNVFTPSWPGPGLPFQFADDTTTDSAAQFVRSNAVAGERFAAYVALNAPHEPFDQISSGEYANEAWPEVQKKYAAMVTNFDRNVGKILSAISDPNNDGNASDSVESNTVVIFTSDNGPLWTPHANGFDTEFFNSNGPFRGEKSNTLEGGIRTPFFVRWNGVTTPGAVNSGFVGSFADVYPTLAELAGEDVPFGLDGRSMAAAITGQGSEGTQQPIVTSSRYRFSGLNQASWCVQLGDWKLIQRMSNMGFELYNLGSDPFETANLANSRPDIRTALNAIAELEGVKEEPFFVTGLSTEPQNAYVTQYKYWEPAGASSDFSTAANWSGGTQYTKDGDAEAKYWNTGPGPNWLAKVANTANTNVAKHAVVSADAKVLAMQIEGTFAPMVVSVEEGATLQAYNGVRVEAAGFLQLEGGRLTTIGEVDVRVGGGLTGWGTIDGFQSLLAGIPEFQGAKFLQPRVTNGGVIDLFSGSPVGALVINGDFEQTNSGLVYVDVLGPASIDSISVSGDAAFDGAISINLANGFAPTLGDLFTLLTADSLSLNGLSLVGPDAGLFSPIVTANSIALVYTAGELTADFDFNGIVNGADLAVWRENFGLAEFAGDANRDGVVDSGDLMIWQQNFGAVLSPALLTSASVPEPSSVMLALGMIGAAASLRRGRGLAQRSVNILQPVRPTSPQ